MHVRTLMCHSVSITEVTRNTLNMAGRRSSSQPVTGGHTTGSRAAAEGGGEPPAHGAAVRCGCREVREGPAGHPGWGATLLSAWSGDWRSAFGLQPNLSYVACAQSYLCRSQQRFSATNPCRHGGCSTAVPVCRCQGIAQRATTWMRGAAYSCCVSIIWTVWCSALMSWSSRCVFTGDKSPEAAELRKACQLNLASCYLNTGRTQSVVELCTDVLATEPGNRKVLQSSRTPSSSDVLRLLLGRRLAIAVNAAVVIVGTHGQWPMMGKGRIETLHGCQAYTMKAWHCRQALYRRGQAYAAQGEPATAVPDLAAALAASPAAEKAATAEKLAAARRAAGIDADAADDDDTVQIEEARASLFPFVPCLS